MRARAITSSVATRGAYKRVFVSPETKRHGSGSFRPERHAVVAQGLHLGVGVAELGEDLT
jgi:hypothetical protein